MNNARQVTNQLLESIDDGLLTNKTVLESLLRYLSEDQVAEFYQSLVDEGYPLPKSPRAAASTPRMSDLPPVAKQPYTYSSWS